jgi:hypothetical protein
MTSQLTIDQLRLQLHRDYEALKTWRKVAQKYQVNVGWIYRIARGGAAPADPAMRLRLGLSVTKEVPVCPECGQVHTVAWCVEKKGEPVQRRIRDTTKTPIRNWSIKRLKDAFNERQSSS